MIKIDESYTILNDTLRGRKPKFKLEKNGKKYIYKYGSVNNEIWAELIAEQLGKQAGINMAHYEIAKYEDTIGVITDYFLKPLELIISSDKLKEATQAIFDENNVDMDLKENTITNIVQAATIYDHTVNSEELTLELMKRWVFYGLIMETDKNDTNIAFIKGENGLTLTPDFDNSSMAGLNDNIQSSIDSIRRGCSIYNYTDNFRTNLKLTRKDTGHFLTDFDNFAKKYPQQCQICMEYMSNIDVEDACDTVETINNVEIPWDIKFWLNKAITARFADMQAIHNKNKGTGKK